MMSDNIQGLPAVDDTMEEVSDASSVTSLDQLLTKQTPQAIRGNGDSQKIDPKLEKYADECYQALSGDNRLMNDKDIISFVEHFTAQDGTQPFHSGTYAPGTVGFENAFGVMISKEPEDGPDSRLGHALKQSWCDAIGIYSVYEYIRKNIIDPPPNPDPEPNEW